MQNTRTEYSSDQRMPVVLPKMEELLPPLSAEQFSALESDILENGCCTPVIVNENMIVINGHNRFRICKKYSLPFKMLVFAFADLLEAKQWALDTQKDRRNLDKWELGKIALKLKPEIEARARVKLSAGGGDHRNSEEESGFANSQNPIPVANTTKELALAVGIGQQTMSRVIQIDEHVPLAVKEAMDSGRLSVNQGYSLTKQLQKLPEGQRDEAAAQAIDFLEQAKKELRELDAAAEHRGRIARLFCKAFEWAVQLRPTRENVQLWVEGTRMRMDEIEDSAKEAQELSEVFATIAELLRTMLPIVIG